jgi:hypothetical protein
MSQLFATPESAQAELQKEEQLSQQRQQAVARRAEQQQAMPPLPGSSFSWPLLRRLEVTVREAKGIAALPSLGGSFTSVAADHLPRYPQHPLYTQKELEEEQQRMQEEIAQEAATKAAGSTAGSVSGGGETQAAALQRALADAQLLLTGDED